MQKKVSLKDLPAFCAELVKTFSSQQLVLLSGPLGVGKTQLVKCCVEALSSRGSPSVAVESPTFSIINSYPTDPPVFHVDLYRLTSATDVESTGFWDLFSEEKAILFVEWPERVDEKEFPLYWKTKKIKIDFSEDEQVRVLEY